MQCNAMQCMLAHEWHVITGLALEEIDLLLGISVLSLEPGQKDAPLCIRQVTGFIGHRT